MQTPVKVTIRVGEHKRGPVMVDLSLWTPEHGGLCYASYWRIPGQGLMSRTVAAMVGTDMLSKSRMRLDLPCEEVVTLLTWEEYDMNMYRLGCEHQRALGWENPDNDREKLIGRKCPECGHRFGCEWGKVDLPDDLVKYVRKRMAEKDG